MKKGYALLIQAGDAEISSALADGIREAKALEPDKIELVRYEIERQRTEELCRRVAMCRGRTSEDWQMLIAKAECDYGESLYEQTVFGKIGEALLVVYAMFVMLADRFFKWEVRRWSA